MALRRAFLIMTAAASWSLAAVLPLAAATAYAPAIKIVFEVRTSEGDLRSFQLPGERPTYWAQDMPVVQGDRLTIDVMIATGSAELGEVKLRLDNENLTLGPQPPARAEVDTTRLVPGYHMVEAWAATKPPEAQESTATATFLVVPPIDPLLAVLKPQPAGPPVSDEERLACTLRSLDPQVDKQVTATSSAAITRPTLFRVVADKGVKEFFYTLSRDGRVTYTSPRLPLATHILLEPQEDDRGLAPGQVILTARAGDGEGKFGPPVWITVNIEGEAAK